MKQRVVFLFYHGLGHVNSFLKAANILEENDYEVWFAGSGFFQQHVKLQGCKFYLLKSYPFGAGLEKWINTIEGKNIYFRTLWDRISDRVFTERQVELFWMLEELKPAVVLIDKMLSTDFIVLYAHLKNRGIKVAMINTMLPTQVSADRPPLNSDVLPTDSRATLKTIHEANWVKKKKKWKQKLMMVGFDDDYIINRAIKKNAIPHRYISTNPDLLRFSTAHVDELILAPREFDFPQSVSQANQKYIGFMTTDSRVEMAEEAYKDFTTRILPAKREKNFKLIYCSFGTVPPKQSDATTSFIEKLASVADEEGFVFVISGKVDEKTTAKARTNFYSFNNVPQLDILRNTDVFITHGGLNSIKEAIHAEVPMLVYPVHLEYDPVGNAARVFYHRLGLRGDIASDSIDELKDKISELLSNKIYKENVRRLKDVDVSYEESTFVDAIDRIKTLK